MTDKSIESGFSVPYADRSTTILQIGLLFAILLLALFLRLYDLNSESVWIDEYWSLPHDTSVTFSEYLSLNRHRGPDGMPLYHFLILAAEKLGFSAPALRVFGVLISLAGCVFIFLAGRCAFGTRAGLVSSLLFASSSYFIYQSQALRPYNIVIILSVLSIYFMLRYNQNPKTKWLVANTVVNGILLGFHLTCSFLLVPIGVYIISGIRKRPWHGILWLGANFSLSLIAASYVTIPPQEPYYQMPNPYDLFNNLLLDDFVDRNPEVLISREGGLISVLSSSPWSLALPATAGLAALMFLSSLLFGIGSWVRNPKGIPEKALFMCFLVAVVPLVLLCVVSFLREPMQLPRYAVFSSVGLYLLFGALYVRLPNRIGTVLLALLLGAYALHLSVFLTSDWRTQWRRVSNLLDDEWKPGDIVMVTRTPDTGFPAIQTEEVMRFNFGMSSTNIPFGYFYDFDRAVFYSRSATQRSSATSQASSWFVLHNSFNTTNSKRLEQALSNNGFDFTCRLFSAQEGITLYRANIARPLQISTVPDLSSEECGRYIRDLRAMGLMVEASEETCRTLSEVLNGDPINVSSPIFLALFALLVLEVDSSLALRVAHQAVELAPDAATPLFILGCAQTLSGQHVEAADSYTRCLSARPDNYPDFFESYLSAMARQDFTDARRQSEKLSRSKALLPLPMQRYFGLDEVPDFYQ